MSRRQVRKSFKGDYFAHPKWYKAALRKIYDHIDQYPPEMRAALYGVYNIPPRVIE